MLLFIDVLKLTCHQFVMCQIQQVAKVFIDVAIINTSINSDIAKSGLL
jgi:hypothetical protein